MQVRPCGDEAINKRCMQVFREAWPPAKFFLRRFFPSRTGRRADPAEACGSFSVSDAASMGVEGRRAVQSGLMRGLFSQLGEDGTLLWIFEGRKNGFYVDIGCHHPLIYSNTAALHTWNHWRGLNVDIDRRAIDLFNQWRPQDINVQLGVSDRSEVVDAYIFESGALSTLDIDAAGESTWASVKRKTERVETLPLCEVFDRFVPLDVKIDFLNIDAEGLDLRILRSNDWNRYRPEVIAVEDHDCDLNNASKSETFQYLATKNYRLVSHTVITSIYRSIST